MLSRLFNRRYFISLSYVLVVVIGIAAWQLIALEMSPDLSLPSITVEYRWGSTSPEVMELQETLPLNVPTPASSTIIFNKF